MAGDLEYAETTLKIHRARIMKIGARSLVDVSEWPRQVGVRSSMARKPKYYCKILIRGSPLDWTAMPASAGSRVRNVRLANASSDFRDRR